MMRVVAAAWLAAAVLTGAPTPFDIRMPDAVAARWNVFTGLPKPPGGALRVRIAPSIASPARVDLLQRESGRWVWQAAWEWSPGFAIPAPPAGSAVLLRQKGAAWYGWGEIPDGRTQAVELRMLKSLDVRGISRDESLLLFLQSESEPRSSKGAAAFHFVPLEPALLCITAAVGDRCVAVAPEARAASLDDAARGDVRVVFAEHEVGEIAVLTAGTSPLRPRRAAMTVTASGSWVALRPKDDGFRWAGAVLDRTSPRVALERIDGAALPPLPSFATIPSRAEKGVIIQPRVGEDRRRLMDGTATLLVFADGEAAPAPIPLAVAPLSEDDTFAFPLLGSGSYQWRLLSSEAAGAPIRASVVSGTPAELLFPEGPAVIGRVVRVAGGGTIEPPSIKAVLQRAVAGTRATELLDAVRFTTARENGEFRMTLSLPGKYRLLARWGSASKEREFEIARDSKIIDLGDIILENGSTLRGSIPPCAGGEVMVASLPDTSKPLMMRLDEPRRTRADASGRFIIDGLHPGSWSIAATCEGKLVSLVPEFVIIPDQGDAIVDLSALHR
jgi:hypothetical protein